MHVAVVGEEGKGGGRLACEKDLAKSAPKKGNAKPANAVHERSDGLKKDNCAKTSAARFAAD